MNRKPEFEGTAFAIQALELPDGSCPAGEFLDSLDASDRTKLDVLFEVLGCTGRISNKEKFKKLEGTKSLWEFKSFQIRIPCFFTSNKRVMLCFGLVKKKDKYRPEEIKRAEEYQATFLGNSRH